MRIGEAARDRQGALRHATPITRDATVLCVFVLNIRDALAIAGTIPAATRLP